MIVGVGDSITAGAPGWDPNPGLRDQWNAHDPQSQWEHWADTELGDGYDVRNCGVSGDRTDEIAFRLDGCISGADVVVLQGGVNDLVQGFSPERAVQNIREMVGRVKAAGLSPLLTNLLPVNRRRQLLVDKITRLNDLIRSLARDENVPVVDFFGLLEDPAGSDRMPARWTADGIHPSVEGYRRLGQTVASDVR